MEENKRSSNIIRIGSRGSQLALTQTYHVRDLLQEKYPNINFEVEVIKTKGDKILDVALSKIGDKGLFTKELEIALVENTIDFAVHSLKDIPTKLPEGLTVGAICKRHDVRDCLVVNEKNLSYNLSSLPQGSVIGSSSLRRVSQLKRAYPHLIFKDVRGNLNTRLQKLDEGQYDGIILAVAGLSRLHLQKRIHEIIPPQVCYYAVGQGALAIECRENDKYILDILSSIHHIETAASCTAERAFLRGVEGGCQIPVGVNCHVEGGNIKLRGIVLNLSGSEAVTGEVIGDLNDPESLGMKLASTMKNNGAEKILQEVLSTIQRETKVN